MEAKERNGQEEGEPKGKIMKSAAQHVARRVTCDKKVKDFGKGEGRAKEPQI